MQNIAKGSYDASTWAAYRVTNRHATAINVYFGWIELQQLVVGNTNHRKGFVDLVKIYILSLYARTRHGQWNGFCRCCCKPFGCLLGIRIADDFSQRLQAKCFTLFFAHQNHRRGAIVQVRGVGSRYGAVFIKYRAKSRQFVETHLTEIFVFTNHNRVFAFYRNFNGSNFSIKFASRPGCCRTGVWGDGISILLFPWNFHFRSAKLGRIAHVIVVVHVGKAILENAIGDLTMTQTHAITGLVEVIRHIAHAFHAAGNHYFVLNALCTQHDGFHATGTNFINRCKRSSVANARKNTRLGGRGLAQVGRNYIAHI